MSGNNPWKGIVSYEANEDTDLHPFCGRNTEIEELFQIVESNTISTLYGKSGIGKTSLLKAGLFPKLPSYYYPISIRLSSKSPSNGYASVIIDCLKDLEHPYKGLKTPELPEGVAAEKSTEFLWHYFAYHEFFYQGKPVIPLIVLDQFEEVLRDKHDEAMLLLRQIRYCKNDGILCNGEPYTIGFRFVLSLREDDLYLLEDILDQNNIDSMKQGRYRLKSLTEEGANEIITVRPDLYESHEKKAISDELIRMATQDGQISTLVLSLLCYRSFEKKSGDKITLMEIKELGDNPLEQFYDEATASLNSEQRRFILNFCITQDGRRCPVDASRIEKELVSSLYDENDQLHLFTKTSGQNGGACYELLHDKLASVVYDKRTKLEEEEKTLIEAEKLREQTRHSQRLRNALIVLSATLLLGIAALILVPQFMGRAIPFDINKHSHPHSNGSGIRVIEQKSRPYCVPSGYLKLENCILDFEGLFVNDFSIKKVSLDDVSFCKNSIYLPSIDTLILKNNIIFYDKTPNTPYYSLNLAFPNATVLQCGMPTSQPTVVHHLPNIKQLQCVLEDTINMRWSYGVLFVNLDSTWYPYINTTKSQTVYYNEKSFEREKVAETARPCLDYDISNKPDTIISDASYRIVCSDNSHRVLTNEDIGSINDNRINVLAISLPQIERIEDLSWSHRFSKWTSLRYVDLPNLKEIPSSLFSGCNSLQSAQLTNATSIRTDAFNNCSSLQEIGLPKATSIESRAFIYCNSLQEIKLPNATYIGQDAFYSCSSLRKVDLPKATSIESRAFNNCISLQEIDLPNAKFIDDGAFYSCSSLREIDLPNVTSIGSDAFSSCSSLRTVYLPKANSVNGGAFAYCSSLERLYMPLVKQIKNKTFYRCYSLVEIRIDSVKMDGLHKDWDESCLFSLQKLYLSGTEYNIDNKHNIAGIKVIKDGYYITDDNKLVIYKDSLEQLDIPNYVINIEGIDNIKYIGKLRKHLVTYRYTIDNGIAFGSLLGTVLREHRPKQFYKPNASLQCFPSCTNEVIVPFASVFVDTTQLPETNCILRVPYGNKSRFLSKKAIPIEEMKWTTTLWYMPIIVFGFSSTFKEVSFWIIGLLVSCALWLVIRKPQDRKKLWQKDLIALSIIYAVLVLLLVSQLNKITEGSGFVDMAWHLAFVLPAWLFYLILPWKKIRYWIVCIFKTLTYKLFSFGKKRLVWTLLSILFTISITYLFINKQKNKNDLTFTIGNTCFVMNYVEGGSFSMGSQNRLRWFANYDRDANYNEQPVHDIIVNNYYIGQTEVTQKQWKAVMGENNNPSLQKGDNLPVDCIDWFEAVSFCNKLSELVGKTPCYFIDSISFDNKKDWTVSINSDADGFRLPSEPEWEYASRGGRNSKGYKYSGSNNIDDVAFYKSNTKDTRPNVSLKKANELGLYDMSGNVWEWCYDNYSIYGNEPTTKKRIVRGGCWLDDATFCRITTRGAFDPESQYQYLGFRIVLQNKF